MPFLLRSVASQETYPNSLSFRYFHLGLASECLKELGGYHRSFIESFLVKVLYEDLETIFNFFMFVDP
jgi:hypothetical protein